MKLAFALFVFGLVQCTSLQTPLNHKEQQQLGRKLSNPPTDLVSAFYSVSGLTALGKEVLGKDTICEIAGKNLDTKSAKALFQFSEITKICGCKNIPSSASITEVLSDASSATDFSYLVAALRNFGNDVDPETLKKFVNLLKENDNPASAAIAFYTVSLFPKNDVFKPVISMVEDIVAQADEVGGNMLQFEGLAVTSGVVHGILKLSDQQNAKLIKDEQVLKFTEYFLSRKFVFTLKDIYYLTKALSTLSNNKNQVPAVVSVFKSNFITKENPSLKVRVTNLFDRSIPDVAVTAKSFTTADDSVTLFDNKQFSKSNDKDDTIVLSNEVAKGYIEAHAYALDVMGAKPKRGMFLCNVGIKISNGKQYIKPSNYGIGLKVLARVMVEDVQVYVAEKDQVSGSPTKLTYPNKLPQSLEADSHQKLVMDFNLKDLNSGEAVTAHQTFIRLTHIETQQEIFFVAEPNSNDHYTFTLDISATAKDSFNYQSGKYKMALVVGDATMQVPISWTMGEVTLKFSGKPASTKRQERLIEPQPIIEHMFRIPEKRPPKIVSTIFTALVLSPLLIMVILWGKIGANLSNLNFSISTIVFHVGLGCIFGLYYMFWVQLNMFQTIKLLAIIGGVTFLGGNKMLADMAAAKYNS